MYKCICLCVRQSHNDFLSQTINLIVNYYYRALFWNSLIKTFPSNSLVICFNDHLGISCVFHASVQSWQNYMK